MIGTRAAAPSGTLTMLFTDIEGSSEGVRTLGTDKWEAVLERHTQIIRDALARHGGFEVRSEGDAFFVVFTSPSEAVAAAAVMQRELSAANWPHQATVRVRMGIHTGEVRPASVASGVDCDQTTAAARFRKSLLLRWRLGPGSEVAAGLAGTAGVALREGQLTEALRLFGPPIACWSQRTRSFGLPMSGFLVRTSPLSAYDWTSGPSMPHSAKGRSRPSTSSRRWPTRFRSGKAAVAPISRRINWDVSLIILRNAVHR